MRVWSRGGSGGVRPVRRWSPGALRGGGLLRVRSGGGSGGVRAVEGPVGRWIGRGEASSAYFLARLARAEAQSFFCMAFLTAAQLPLQVLSTCLPTICAAPPLR